MIIKCANCGKDKKVSLCDLKKYRNHFCNKKCRGEWLSKQPTTQVELTCAKCGKKKLYPKCYIEKRKALGTIYFFCGNKCASKFFGKYKNKTMLAGVKRAELVEIVCICGKKILKKKSYMERQEKNGQTQFLCGDPKCTAKYSIMCRQGKPSKLKGKSLEEKVGKQRAKQLKEESSIRTSIGNRLGINGFKGRKHSLESKQKMKRPSPTKGKKLEELVGDERAKQLKKENSERSKKHHANPEYRKSQSEKALARWQDPEYRKRCFESQQLSPTKPEITLMHYFKENNLPYKYTGDRKFWLENANPDFVNTNGEKAAIEMQGCFWHGCKKCYPNGAGRKDIVDKNVKRDLHKEQVYQKYGWKVINIWEHEISDGSYVDKLKR